MMTWVLKEEWFWIIALSIILVLVIPFAIVWFILNLPPDGRIIVTIALIIGWGVVAGYKDWLTSKKREEEREKHT